MTGNASPRRSPPNPVLVFFGGKGGVGKTTCASAFALAITGPARRRGTSAAALISSKAPRRALIVSTDPAHSLGDVLGLGLSASPRRVGRGLDAVELDARRAFRRWLRENRGPLGDILEHGTWLDREDVSDLLDLPFPGIDELVGLLEIARLSRARPYDTIVVDSAPTGHMLRLLAAPECVHLVAGILDDLQAEHRLIRDRLARVGRGPEAADRVIERLAAMARDAAQRLRDPRQTSVRWVTLPEMMSIEESADAVAALEESGIRVDEILVNRVLPAARPCPLCDRRRQAERKSIAALRRRLGRGRRIRTIASRVAEIRGTKALAGLFDPESPDSDATSRATRPRGRGSALSGDPPGSVLGLRHASLVFVGGKGGVGKTTVAAAIALRLARADVGRRILLLSTDPAHSLGDLLRAPVGDTAASLRGGFPNLMVRELDAARALAAKRADLEAALNEIGSAFGAGSGTAHAADLLNLAPPGIDELIAITSVLDSRDAYQPIVIDTAPTGHALRLLETPDAAAGWIHALLRVLLKYRDLVRPGRLARELVALSKSVRALQAMLRDARRTQFVVVTRAGEVPRIETERLVSELKRLRLATPLLVVNALTASAGTCARCGLTMQAEQAVLDKLEAWSRRARGRSRGWAIIHTPLWAPPPAGVRALEQWTKEWIGAT